MTHFSFWRHCGAIQGQKTGLFFRFCISSKKIKRGRKKKGRKIRGRPPPIFFSFFLFFFRDSFLDRKDSHFHRQGFLHSPALFFFFKRLYLLGFLRFPESLVPLDFQRFFQKKLVGWITFLEAFPVGWITFRPKIGGLNYVSACE